MFGFLICLPHFYDITNITIYNKSNINYFSNYFKNFQTYQKTLAFLQQTLAIYISPKSRIHASSPIVEDNELDKND